jgi:hypothetical protein
MQTVGDWMVRDNRDGSILVLHRSLHKCAKQEIVATHPNNRLTLRIYRRMVLIEPAKRVEMREVTN